MADHAPQVRPHAHALKRHDMFSKTMRHGCCQTVCILFWWLLVAFAGLTVFSVSVRFSKGNDPSIAYEPRFTGVLLPGFASPSAYELFVRIDPVAKIFSGTVKIDCMLSFPSNKVVLHADPGLTVSSFQYALSGGSLTSWPIISRLPEEQFIIGQTSKILSYGKITLYLEFNGVLSASTLQGLYLSPYKKADGTSDVLVSTQFEPTAARRMFPCFDEPHFKAVFVVSISAPGSRTVLGNMPVVSSVVDPVSAYASAGYMKRTFAPTVVMSTYLVAVVVGNLEYIETTSSTGIPVRAYTTIGNSANAAIALDTAARALTVFGDLLGVAYALPKLDLVAIPDFEAGAMENYGLITFRTSAMLVSGTTGTQPAIQRVVVIVCHEVAHMWFGDYVTMDWWNNLWLNEGFATYFEYVCADALYPSWDIWGQFPETEMPAALATGAHASAHPLMAGNNSMNPASIPGLFDAVTYSKGASLLRMVQIYMKAKESAPDSFYQGLKMYLIKHALSTTKPEDVWSALTAAGGFDVSRFMRPWVTQRGYPVVNADFSPSTDTSKINVRIAQSRFNLIPNPKDTTLWQLPMMFTPGGGAPATLVMALAAVQTVAMPVPVNPKCASCSFYIINSDRMGYYRSNYSLDVWYSMSDAMAANIDAIAIHDRTSMLDNLFAFMLASQLPSEPAMRFFRAMIKVDTTYFGWTSLARQIAALLSAVRSPLAAPTTDLATVQGFISANMANYLAANPPNFAPWTGSDFFGNLLRSKVLASALLANHPATVAAALAAYTSYKNDTTTVDALLVQLVLDTAAGNGMWAELEAKFLAAHNAGDEATALQYVNAMTRAAEDYNVRNTLQYLMRQDNIGHYYVQPQNFPYVIARAAGSLTGGREVTYTFVTNNWNTISNNYARAGFGWGVIIQSVFGSSNTAAHTAEVETFLNANISPLLAGEADLAMETNTALTAFVTSQAYTTMIAWLKVNQ